MFGRGSRYFVRESRTWGLIMLTVPRFRHNQIPGTFSFARIQGDRKSQELVDDVASHPRDLGYFTSLAILRKPPRTRCLIRKNICREERLKDSTAMTSKGLTWCRIRDKKRNLYVADCLCHRTAFRRPSESSSTQTARVDKSGLSQSHTTKDIHGRP
jgi:hypothetical protein